MTYKKNLHYDSLLLSNKEFNTNQTKVNLLNPIYSGLIEEDFETPLIHQKEI